jgi:hypothetical protein
MFNRHRYNGPGSALGGIGIPPIAPGTNLATVNYALSVAIAGTDGTRLKRSFTETGRRSIDLSRNFFSGSSNVVIPTAWSVARTQALYLLATADLTIKTNSPTAPANTITLKAGMPLYWNASAGLFPNPFTADVTALYCSCAAASLLLGAILTT